MTPTDFILLIYIEFIELSRIEIIAFSIFFGEASEISTFTFSPSSWIEADVEGPKEMILLVAGMLLFLMKELKLLGDEKIYI
jgi:hypothetical protein